MKIIKSLLKPEWIKFNDKVSFKVRPFPASHKAIMSWGELNAVKVNQKMFDYCVIEWKGIKGEDGKELECNSENKEDLFSNSIDIMVFVLNHSNSISDKVVEKKT